MDEDKHCINCKHKYIEPDALPCNLCITCETKNPKERHPYWESEEVDTNGNGH